VNVTNPSFSGHGVLFYQDPKFATSDRTITNIAFNVSTTSQKGVIMWNGEVSVYNKVSDWSVLIVQFVLTSQEACSILSQRL
jgi:hypothetical protein